jgi:hypothetical protein
MAQRPSEPEKNAAAVLLGKLGAAAYLRNTTPKQRADGARRAAQARWARVAKAKAKS